MTFIVFFGVLNPAFEIRPVRAVTIVVPDDYSTIQEAINAANHRDVIYVRNGTFFENVVVNKSISLVGEHRESTIIDGGGVGNAVKITVDNVTVTAFTVRNSGTGPSAVAYYFSKLRIVTYLETIYQTIDTAFGL